jgi:branched-chain amino acid transport system substrate-binding protein
VKGFSSPAARPRRSSARRRVRAILALVPVACGLAACHPKPEREVRIGLLALLNSELATQSGAPSQRGAQMAADAINAEGGVDIRGKRHRVRLVVRDYEPRPDAAASAARALINLDSVDVIVGPNLSSHALSAATVAEDARVPLITPLASNPAVTAGRHYVFRLSFLDPFQGETLARYARDDLRAARAAVLYDIADPYARDITALFTETFMQLGGTIVATETFTSDQTSDFVAQLRRIAASNPDVLLLPNHASVDSVQVRQARAAGIRARFLGTDNWDPPALRHIPEAVGTVIVHQWHIASPRLESQAFVGRYRTRYEEEPRTSAALTFDAVRLAADAIHRAGSLDGDMVRAALSQTRDFAGVVATYTYNGSGNPRRGAVLSRIGATSDSVLHWVEPHP